MTFNHIVFKNLRQNLKHYAMYLFSLFFSIVLYFSFTTLQFTKGVNNDDSMAIIKKGALVKKMTIMINKNIDPTKAPFLMMAIESSLFTPFSRINIFIYHYCHLFNVCQSFIRETSYT
jgi:hypothetical protein